MPRVSILIPVFNTERYIRKSIGSVLQQTFEDWELIIVDDCSTDGTYSICVEIAGTDSRIKLFRNENNLGMMKNWNVGLAKCSGEFFGKLDADDWWRENMIEDAVKILDQYPKVGLVFSKYQLVDESDKIISSENPLPVYARNSSFTGMDLIKRGIHGMFSDNVIRQGISLMRRKLFRELGLFTLHDAGDTEMWFRIAAHYSVYGMNESYHFHRVWNNNFTRQNVLGQNKVERNLFEVREMILSYYFKQNLLPSKKYRQYSGDNTFEYQKYLLYRYRTEQKKPALRLFLKMILNRPLKTIQFYLDRLKSRTLDIFA